MNIDELKVFLKDNPRVETEIKGDRILFIDREFEEAIEVTKERFEKLTPAELRKQLTNGKNITCITRVTGYFSKTSGWNKGKTGELKDRVRTEVA